MSWVKFDKSNNPSPTPDPYPANAADTRVGDTFTVRFVEPGLMESTPVVVNGHTSGLGNPFICAADVAAPWSAYCGA